MITAIKPMLKQILTSIGVTPVYTDAEDEGKIKGLKYAWVYVVDPERVIRDGNTIVAKNDQYYLREYELRLKVGVRIAAKDETEAAAFKIAFLNALALSPTVIDQQGFDIEIEVLAAEFIADKSILKTGSGYEVIVTAVGGVYRPTEQMADPWVMTLVEWTDMVLADPWRAYPFYPMGKPDMTVYWRVVSCDVEDKGRAFYAVRKKLTGHIFARDNLATWAALKIAEALQAAFKIPYNIPAKQFLTVEKPDVNLRNNPMTGGQVSVTLLRNTTRPTEEAPMIGRFYPGGTLQEG